MFETLVDADDRSQVGIETLIVFIAMILVAAIAAGILIDTAGFLQNKAAATSQDSTSQVSNQIVVVSAVGQVNVAGTNVTAVNFTVMKSPGADEIDLGEATIGWAGPEGHSTMVMNDSDIGGTAPIPDCLLERPPCAFFEILHDDDGSAPVLNAKSDRVKIHVPLVNDTVRPATLRAGEEATAEFVTQSGSTSVYVVNVPESLASDGGSAVSV